MIAAAHVHISHTAVITFMKEKKINIILSMETLKKKETVSKDKGPF